RKQPPTHLNFSRSQGPCFSLRCRHLADGIAQGFRACDHIVEMDLQRLERFRTMDGVHWAAPHVMRSERHLFDSTGFCRDYPAVPSLGIRGALAPAAVIQKQDIGAPGPRTVGFVREAQGFVDSAVLSGAAAGAYTWLVALAGAGHDAGSGCNGRGAHPATAA